MWCVLLVVGFFFSVSFFSTLPFSVSFSFFPFSIALSPVCFFPFSFMSFLAELNGQVGAIFEELETGMELLGVTGVEDKLQVYV